MDLEKLGAPLLAIVSGIFALAFVSVLVGKNSKAPALINATAKSLSTLVSAAVNPVNTATTNGNLGLNTFSTPANVGETVGATLGGLFGH